MRVFVAADIDPETRAQISAVRQAIEGFIGAASTPPRVSWVNADAAHVTLRFIGEVPDATAHALQQALRVPLEFAAFHVQWDRLGAFPGGRYPRVVWIGSTGDQHLARLAEAVNARIGSIVGPGETRRFKPHVTIGRVRDPGRGVDWRRAVSAAPIRPTVTRVDHVTLFASQLSPKGSTYTSLCHSPLEVNAAGCTSNS